MSRTNLAIVFGPCIFKSPDSKKLNLDASVALIEENFLHVKWMEFLLENFYDIWPSEVRSIVNDSFYERMGMVRRSRTETITYESKADQILQAAMSTVIFDHGSQKDVCFN